MQGKLFGEEEEEEEVSLSRRQRRPRWSRSMMMMWLCSSCVSVSVITLASQQDSERGERKRESLRLTYNIRLLRPQVLELRPLSKSPSFSLLSLPFSTSQKVRGTTTTNLRLNPRRHPKLGIPFPSLLLLYFIPRPLSLSLWQYTGLALALPVGWGRPSVKVDKGDLLRGILLLLENVMWLLLLRKEGGKEWRPDLKT